MADAAFDPVALLLARGVVTPAQVDESRRALGPDASPAALIEDLLARGVVDRDELAAIGAVSAARAETPLAPLPGLTRIALERGEIPRPGSDATDTRPGNQVLPGTAEAPGPRRLGRFEIVRELGRGGMGVVYQALDTRLRRMVALKGLVGTVTGLDDPEAARFRREARAAARLRHPGIIAVHEVGEIDGQAYLVMDYVEGPTLARYLADRRGEFREGARLVREAAEAIDHAHREGILHRDLKPENILVDAAGKALVGDFGLAREASERGTRLTATGAVLGTPAYMAPEQAEGRLQDLSPRTDVWGLGAVLYQVLAGRAPFEGGTLAEVVYRVVTEEPVPPSRLDSRVPRDLETICLTCLEKDPARRYASARELADDLGRFLAGESIRARPAGVVRRLTRWAGRRRALVAALALAASIGAWALGATWTAESRRRSVVESEFYRKTEVRLVDALGRQRAGDAEGLRRVIDDTVAQADQFLAGDPASVAAHSVRGWVLRLAGRLEEAEASLSRALEGKPDDAFLRYQRALTRAERYRAARDAAERRWLALRLAADPAAASGLPEETELARLDPDLPGRRERAEEDLRGLERSAADSPLADLGRGAAECVRGYLALYGRRHAAAEELFRGALAADRYRDEAWDGLIASLPRDPRPAGAANDAVLAACGEAIETNRGRWQPWCGRADLQARRAAYQGRREGRPAASKAWDAALQDAKRACDLAPDLAEPWRVAAWILSALGDEELLGGHGPDLLAEAIEVTGKALALEPGDPEALLSRAGARLSLARVSVFDGAPDAAILDAAIRDCTEAIALAPGRGDARLFLARAWRLQAEIAKDAGGDPIAPARRGLAECAAAAPRLPFTAEVVVEQATLLLLVAGGEDDPRATLREAEETLAPLLAGESPPRSALHVRGMVRAGRAHAAEEHGEDPRPLYAQSIADFDRALAADPEDVAVRSARANAHALLGQARMARGEDAQPHFRQALADAEAALARRAADLDAHKAAGDALQGLADGEAGRRGDPRELLERALAAYDRYLGRRAGDAGAWNHRALAAQKLGDALAARQLDPGARWAEAARDFARAVELDPGLWQAHVNRGASLNARAEWEIAHGREAGELLQQALEAFGRAGEKGKSVPEIPYNRGRVHLTQARFARTTDEQAECLRQALAEFEASAAVRAEYGPAHLARGVVLGALGRWEEAVAAYEEATRRLGEGVPGLAEQLAQARAQAKQGK